MSNLLKDSLRSVCLIILRLSSKRLGSSFSPFFCYFDEGDSSLLGRPCITAPNVPSKCPFMVRLAVWFLFLSVEDIRSRIWNFFLISFKSMFSILSSINGFIPRKFFLFTFLFRTSRYVVFKKALEFIIGNMSGEIWSPLCSRVLSKETLDDLGASDEKTLAENQTILGPLFWLYRRATLF